MKITNNIQKIVTNYPKITLLGYQFMKKIWNLQADFTNYNYPTINGKATISKAKVLEYNKARDFGPKKRICYAPFNNMHFKIDGEVAACSFNRETLIGNINQNSIKEIWFGKDAEILRENLGNYNFEKCYGCKLVLNSGNYRSFPANKYDYHASDNATYPTQMSFEISNLCNLECLMCDEELSSSIRKNRVKLPPLKDVYPSNFTEQLQEFIPHLSIATFIGGEPLLIKKYYEIWEKIIAANPSCKIHLQTNATYLPEKFLSLLNSKQFDVGISMEGCTKETFEKIRVRGNFETVNENIKKLVALKNKGIVYLNINFCPLTLNWKEVPLMVKYANNLKVSLKLLNVETPRNLALKNKNAHYLNTVYQFLINYKFEETENDFITTRNNEAYQFFVKTIQSYIIEAKKRDDFFNRHVHHTIADFKKIITEDFLLSNVFNYLSKEQKIFYAEKIVQFIADKTNDEIVLQKTLMRFSYFFKEIMNEEDTFKDMEKSFYKLQKIAAEFLELENEEMKEIKSKSTNLSYV